MAYNNEHSNKKCQIDKTDSGHNNIRNNNSNSSYNNTHNNSAYNKGTKDGQKDRFNKFNKFDKSSKFNQQRDGQTSRTGQQRKPFNNAGNKGAEDKPRYDTFSSKDEEVEDLGHRSKKRDFSQKKKSTNDLEDMIGFSTKDKNRSKFETKRKKEKRRYEDDWEDGWN